MLKNEFSFLFLSIRMYVRSARDWNLSLIIFIVFLVPLSFNINDEQDSRNGSFSFHRFAALYYVSIRELEGGNAYSIIRAAIKLPPVVTT